MERSEEIIFIGDSSSLEINNNEITLLDDSSEELINVENNKNKIVNNKNLKNDKMLENDCSKKEIDNKVEMSFMTETHTNGLPKTYEELRDFIRTNKQNITNNPKMIILIIKKLNTLLFKAENMSELKKDISVILETIKLEYDSLLKEYRKDLSLPTLIFIANKGKMEDFFIELKNKNKSITFADQLVLQFERAVKPTVVKNTVKENVVSKKITPDLVETVNNEITEVALKIKKIISNRKIEYFNLVLDPKSFSKTIYNIFNLSLSLRMKYVSFYKEEDGLYVGPYNDISSEFNLEDNMHAVIEITPQKYKQLLKEYEIEKAMLN